MNHSDPPKQTSDNTLATATATTDTAFPSTTEPWNYDGTTIPDDPTSSPTSTQILPTSTPASSHNSGVSAGTVAGAVVGIVFGLALIGLIAFFVMRRRRRVELRKNSAEQPRPNDDDDMEPTQGTSNGAMPAGQPIGLRTYGGKGNESRSNISVTSEERRAEDDMVGWKQVEARSVV